MATPSAPSVLLPERFSVRRVSRETRDTSTIEIAPIEGASDRRFAPGQFNMLYAFGIGEVPISISGDPSLPGPFVHTIRAVGAVSRALCSLKRDAALGVRGPFGTSWPLDAAAGRDVVLVTGGIGLAPLRPVVRAILSDRGRYGRVTLLLGARTPGDLLFRRELESWRGRLDFDVRVTVDAAAPDWRGDVGVVTKLIPEARVDAANAVAMICGPEIMMRYSLSALRDRGLTPDRAYVSMERNMKCAVGICGHCQYGPVFLCKDGPVFRFDRLLPWFGRREL